MGRMVVLDIDGVLTVSWKPLPGAAENAGGPDHVIDDIGGLPDLLGSLEPAEG